jgi:transcriptional regulator of acetoin/glycerol metabolism
MQSLEKLISPVVDQRGNHDLRYLDEDELIMMNKIKRVKHEVISQKIQPSQIDFVRAEIVKSWIRSHEYGLNPDQYNYGPVLDKHHLKKQLEAKDTLIKTASPYIKELENILSQTNCIISLSDEQGVILQVAHGNFEAESNRFQLIPGAIWNEQVKGTCAHIMSLLLKSPIQICGSEHYFEEFEQTTSSSVPIFDASNNLQGTLTVGSPYLHCQNPHTLALVVSMAWAIQTDLQKKDLLNNTLHTSTEAILFLNKNGIITNANKAALQLFGDQAEKIVGYKIRQPLIQPALATGKGMQEVDFPVEIGGTQFNLSTIQPIRDYNGNDAGCILTLKSHKLAGKTPNAIIGTKTRFTFNTMIGCSPQFQSCVKLAKKFAAIDVNILIQGESGTGKEVFAQSIHHLSRPDGPFMAVNCAAIPRTLIESELFGYEGGAFTGAEQKGKKGKFEIADHGTFFLDEIGDMPLELQAVLLRVLDDKCITRVGGTLSIPVNFRLITATHKDLLALVKKGVFREDLYYRLAVFKLKIPALRENSSDIIHLTQHFMKTYAEAQHLPVPALSTKAKYILLNYPWPGNIRQLQNSIIYAVNMASHGIIHPEDLPEQIFSSTSLTPKEQSDPLSNPSLEMKQTSMKDMERSAIVQALEQCQNNIREASRILGVSKATLYRKIKEYGFLDFK